MKVWYEVEAWDERTGAWIRGVASRRQFKYKAEAINYADTPLLKQRIVKVTETREVVE